MWRELDVHGNEVGRLSQLEARVDTRWLWWAAALYRRVANMGHDKEVRPPCMRLAPLRAPRAASALPGGAPLTARTGWALCAWCAAVHGHVGAHHCGRVAPRLDRAHVVAF